MPRVKINGGGFFDAGIGKSTLVEPKVSIPMPQGATPPKRARLPIPSQTRAEGSPASDMPRAMLYACASALAPWLRCEIGSHIEDCSTDRCSCLAAARCVFTSLQHLTPKVRRAANGGLLAKPDDIDADIVWQRILGAILNESPE